MTPSFPPNRCFKDARSDLNSFKPESEADEPAVDARASLTATFGSISMAEGSFTALARVDRVAEGPAMGCRLESNSMMSEFASELDELNAMGELASLMMGASSGGGTTGLARFLFGGITLDSSRRTKLLIQSRGSLPATYSCLFTSSANRCAKTATFHFAYLALAPSTRLFRFCHSCQCRTLAER